MTTKELKEQLQEDILSVLEGWGVSEALDPNDWEKLKDTVCDIIISNVNKLKQ
jgi:hypothetical protein